MGSSAVQDIRTVTSESGAQSRMEMTRETHRFKLAVAVGAEQQRSSANGMGRCLVHAMVVDE